MLNFVSFMDETGRYGDPKLKYVGMAGFVAPSGVWEVFSERWEDVMRKAGFNDYFHMNEFAHSVGQFECWAGPGHESERRLFFARLMDLILETRAVPIGVIISIDAFRSLTPQQQAQLVDPYYVAFATCARASATQAWFRDEAEKVAMVYAYQDEYGTTEKGRAEWLWHFLQSRAEYGHRMGSYASGRPMNLPPLQAADLFAYELAHEFENQDKRPMDKMRWGLRQILTLVEGPIPAIMLYGRGQLLQSLRANKCPDETGFEEILRDHDLVLAGTRSDDTSSPS